MSAPCGRGSFFLTLQGRSVPFNSLIAVGNVMDHSSVEGVGGFSVAGGV